MPLGAMPSPANCSEVGVEMAYPLFRTTNTTGQLETAAIFSPAWKSPSEAAPSPK